MANNVNNINQITQQVRHKNSLEAYKIIEPELTTREKEVYAIVSNYPLGITMRDVAKIMDVGVNQISGRFGSLTHEKKKLVITGKVKVGRFSHSLYVTKENFKPQTSLF